MIIDLVSISNELYSPDFQSSIIELLDLYSEDNPDQNRYLLDIMINSHLDKVSAKLIFYLEDIISYYN